MIPIKITVVGYGINSINIQLSTNRSEMGPSRVSRYRLVKGLIDQSQGSNIFNPANDTRKNQRQYVSIHVKVVTCSIHVKVVTVVACQQTGFKLSFWVTMCDNVWMRW
jgi:hypothetical protein